MDRGLTPPALGSFRAGRPLAPGTMLAFPTTGSSFVWTDSRLWKRSRSKCTRCRHGDSCPIRSFCDW
jgi:hypothetical protein